MMMRGGGQLERALDHLARVERRVVDRAAALHLVADQDVLAVEEQDAEMLGRLVLHGELEVVDQRRPGADHRPLLDLLLQHALKQGVDGLEQDLGEAQIVVARARRSGSVASGVVSGVRTRRSAGAPPPARRRGPPKRSISVLGDRLGVATVDGEEEQQLEQLVVGQRLRRGVGEALAQPLAVAVIVLGAPAGEGGGAPPRRAPARAPAARPAPRRSGRARRGRRGAKPAARGSSAAFWALSRSRRAKVAPDDPERPVARRLGAEAGVGEGGLERVGEAGACSIL